MESVSLLNELPVDLNRAVGRIVVTHALLEHHLQMSLTKLLGVGHKEGAIVLAGLRSEDKLRNIKRLIKVHGLAVMAPANLTAKFVKRVREDKNLFACGVWSRSSQGYLVLPSSVSGPEHRGIGSGKINQAGILTNATALAAVLALVTDLRKSAETLRDRIEVALKSSPRKPG
jgi:hypothetical protein